MDSFAEKKRAAATEQTSHRKGEIELNGSVQYLYLKTGRDLRSPGPCCIKSISLCGGHQSYLPLLTAKFNNRFSVRDCLLFSMRLKFILFSASPKTAVKLFRMAQ